VFRRIYRAKVPIRRMRPVDRYGGDDHRSMRADNTSAFNCRYVGGEESKKVWSGHAYGTAIDVNDFENPYVDRRGRVPEDETDPVPGLRPLLRQTVRRRRLTLGRRRSPLALRALALAHAPTAPSSASTAAVSRSATAGTPIALITSAKKPRTTSRRASISGMPRDIR